MGDEVSRREILGGVGALGALGVLSGVLFPGQALGAAPSKSDAVN
ncbi:MAG: twin-arginine translocation signal domain-containing protein [Desulfomonilaceae bacterium]